MPRKGCVVLRRRRSADAASDSRGSLDSFRCRHDYLRYRLGAHQADRHRKLKMTQAWKTMVADAIAKPPAKRTPLEIESIRVALHLSWLGQRLKRLMDQENEDEITDEQFHDALVEIRNELLA